MRSLPLVRSFSGFAQKPIFPAFFVTPLKESDPLRIMLTQKISKFNLPQESAHIIPKGYIPTISGKNVAESLFVIFAHGQNNHYGHTTDLGSTIKTANNIREAADGQATIIIFSCSSGSAFLSHSLHPDISLLSITGDKETISPTLIDHNLDIILSGIAAGYSARHTSARLVAYSPDIMHFDDVLDKAKNPGQQYRPKKANIIGNIKIDEIAEALEKFSLDDPYQSQRILKYLKSTPTNLDYPKEDFTVPAVRKILKFRGEELPRQLQVALEKMVMEKLSPQNILPHQISRAEKLFPDIDLRSEIEQDFNQKIFIDHLFSMLAGRSDTESSLKQLCQLYPQHIDNRSRSGFTPLGIAIKFGHVNSVEILVNAGADIENVGKDEAGNPQTALMMAAQNSKIPAARFLAKSQTAEYVNKQDALGETALMKAVLKNNLDMVFELAKFSDLDLRDNNGNTALDLALRFSKKDILTSGFEPRIVTALKISRDKRLPSKSPEYPFVLKTELEQERQC